MSRIMINRAVVSGANGFVGHAVIKELLKRGVQVDALVHHETRMLEDERVRYIPFNLADPDAVKACITEPPDVFFAFAWAGSAGTARCDYRLQFENAVRTADCVRLAKEIGCRSFIGAGSITEMETHMAVAAQGNRPGMPYIYGSAKSAAHEACKCLSAELELDFLWACITNAYGPGEHSPRFINTTLRKLISGEKLSFTAATQNYDFVYIDDIARAFYLIAERGRPFCEYLIGSGGAQPLRNYIEEIRNTLAPGRDLLFGDIPFTGVNLPLSMFSVAEIQRDTGFAPEISFDEGIKRTLKWILQEQ
jgi:nucleoside-diphosphate-sugar epimerase